MAQPAMGKCPPTPDVIVNTDPSMLRTYRPRPHSLARCTRLGELALQAQAQLDNMQRWLHNQNQPLKPLELSKQKRNVVAVNMTPGSVQNHDKLAQQPHNAYADSDLLPQHHGLTTSQECTEEEGIVFVHDSVPLSNPFEVLEELPAFEAAMPPMEVSDTSVQRKRRPTNDLSQFDSPSATVERPTLSAERVRTRPSQNDPAEAAVLPSPSCTTDVDAIDLSAPTMEVAQTSQHTLDNAASTFTVLWSFIGRVGSLASLS